MLLPWSILLSYQGAAEPVETGKHQLVHGIVDGQRLEWKQFDTLAMWLDSLSPQRRARRPSTLDNPRPVSKHYTDW